ncbi:MAG: methyltransferase domain-containing protein [Acidobacteriota bacterium]|nr:methyltransferase domain-containing protein [Acidobacteriota bacterium]
METSLLALLRCPICRAPVEEGERVLACTGCERAFPVENGIPLMLHEDLPGAREKLRETAGWVEKAKAEGWYEPDDAVDAVLPFVNRDLGWNDLVWLANGHSFQVLLDRYVGDLRGLRVLEVGAAKAWAARYWLERDCAFVATDILVDPKIGLGRGAFYGDFGRVQADGEHLPFADASFDVVYCVATLHHALDLPRMVKEMARVARPGAVVAGLNEGTRGLGRSPENPDQAGEKEVGINEHVHTVWAYLASFARAGLRVRRLERPDGWPPSPYGRLLSKIPKVGLSVGTAVHLSAVHYCGVSVYARKPA